MSNYFGFATMAAVAIILAKDANAAMENMCGADENADRSGAGDPQRSVAAYSCNQHQSESATIDGSDQVLVVDVTAVGADPTHYKDGGAHTWSTSDGDTVGQAFFPCGGGISADGSADQAGWRTGSESNLIVKTSAQAEAAGYHSGLGGNFYQTVDRYPYDAQTGYGNFAPCGSSLAALIGQTSSNTGCTESQCCTPNECKVGMAMTRGNGGTIAPDATDFAYDLMEGSFANCIGADKTTGDTCTPICPAGSTYGTAAFSFTLQCTGGTGEIKDPNMKFNIAKYGDLAGPKAPDDQGNNIMQTRCENNECDAAKVQNPEANVAYTACHNEKSFDASTGAKRGNRNTCELACGTYVCTTDGTKGPKEAMEAGSCASASVVEVTAAGFEMVSAAYPTLTVSEYNTKYGASTFDTKLSLSCNEADEFDGSTSGGTHDVKCSAHVCSEPFAAASGFSPDFAAYNFDSCLGGSSGQLCRPTCAEGYTLYTEMSNGGAGVTVADAALNAFVLQCDSGGDFVSINGGSAGITDADVTYTGTNGYGCVANLCTGGPRPGTAIAGVDYSDCMGSSVATGTASCNVACNEDLGFNSEKSSNEDQTVTGIVCDSNLQFDGTTQTGTAFGTTNATTEGLVNDCKANECTAGHPGAPVTADATSFATEDKDCVEFGSSTVETVDCNMLLDFDACKLKSSGQVCTALPCAPGAQPYGVDAAGFVLICNVNGTIINSWNDASRGEAPAPLAPTTYVPGSTCMAKGCNTAYITGGNDGVDYSDCNGKDSLATCTPKCMAGYEELQAATANGGTATLDLVCDGDGGFSAAAHQLTCAAKLCDTSIGPGYTNPGMTSSYINFATCHGKRSGETCTPTCSTGNALVPDTNGFTLDCHNTASNPDTGYNLESVNVLVDPAATIVSVGEVTLYESPSVTAGNKIIKVGGLATTGTWVTTRHVCFGAGVYIGAIESIEVSTTDQQIVLEADYDTTLNSYAAGTPVYACDKFADGQIDATSSMLRCVDLSCTGGPSNPVAGAAVGFVFSGLITSYVDISTGIAPGDTTASLQTITAGGYNEAKAVGFDSSKDALYDPNGELIGTCNADLAGGNGQLTCTFNSASANSQTVPAGTRLYFKEYDGYDSCASPPLNGGKTCTPECSATYSDDVTPAPPPANAIQLSCSTVPTTDAFGFVTTGVFADTQSGLTCVPNDCTDGAWDIGVVSQQDWGQMPGLWWQTALNSDPPTNLGDFLDYSSCLTKVTDQDCTPSCKAGWTTTRAAARGIKLRCDADKTFIDPTPAKTLTNKGSGIRGASGALVIGVDFAVANIGHGLRCDSNTCSAARNALVGVDYSDCIGKYTGETCTMTCQTGYTDSTTVMASNPTIDLECGLGSSAATHTFDGAVWAPGSAIGSFTQCFPNQCNVVVGNNIASNFDTVYQVDYADCTLLSSKTGTTCVPKCPIGYEPSSGTFAELDLNCDADGEFPKPSGYYCVPKTVTTTAIPTTEEPPTEEPTTEEPTTESSKDCTELGWSPITGNVCGHAKRNLLLGDGVNYGCPEPKKVKMAAADTACTAAGARLCTVNEIAAGAGKSTGCKTDSAYLWTSDVCTLRAGTPQRAQGVSIVKGQGMKNGATQEACASPDTEFAYRCCADHTPTSQARQSCDQLTWTKSTDLQTSCGQSQNLGGVGEMADCYDKHDWSFAAEVCARKGARLCSLNEIQSGVGKSTGCQHDSNRIWTGEPCAQSSAENYFYSLKGNGKQSSLKCEPVSKRRGIKCCSDSAATLPGPTLTLAQVGPAISAKTCSSTEQAGWKKEAGTCAASLIPNSAGVASCWATRTWQEANAICASAGARLCTLGEIGVTEETGCNFDYQYVWLAVGQDSVCAADGESKTVRPSMATITKCQAETQTAAVRCCSSD